MHLSERKPDFERLRTALLRRGEPDCVPLFDISVADVVMSGFMGRPVYDPTRVATTLTPPSPEEALRHLPDFVAFYAAAGYDFVPVRFGVGAQIITALESGQAGGTDTVRHAGGAGERTWPAEHGGFIKSWEDLQAFPWPAPGTLPLDVFAAAARLLPAGMKVIAHGSGMLMGTRVYMGMERFWLALGEDPALAVALLEKLQELQIVAIDQATDYPGIGAFFLDEDLAHCTGLLESPRFLRRHVFPFFRRVADLVHAKGLPLIMHSDGDIRQVLPDVVACGVDAIHPIEPKAMDIVEIKRSYGDRLALLGNVDVGLLTLGSPEEIRAQVQALMRDVAPGGGFAAGSGNSVPDYVPLDNYRALVAAGLEFGRRAQGGQEWLR